MEQLMKKLVLALALTFMSISSSVSALEPDKVAHLWTSAAFGVAAGTATYHLADKCSPVERIAISSGIAFVPGLAVEIADSLSKHNHFDFGDLGMDAAGAIAGVVTAELFNGQFWISASGSQIRLFGTW